MKIDELIAAARKVLADLLSQRESKTGELAELRSKLDDGGDVTEEQVQSIVEARKAIDEDITHARARVEELEEEKRSDEAAAQLARDILGKGSVDRAPARVGQEARTYRPDTDKRGKQFVRDVARGFLFNDPTSNERLARHMREEQVERGSDYAERAVGTGAFTGLVVPQYLTELFAPHAKAGRPFADACRKHDLPAEGMTVNIGKMTTGSSTAIQSSENSAVSETNVDDTLISPAVQTNAGQQTMSRQSVERSAGAEDSVLEDLFRTYGTTLDSTLLNQATNGLTNVATSIAYTDASPTAAELYPKLLAANSAVETALLDMDQSDAIFVMHSRRWHWLQSQLSSTWPLFGQPGIGAQQGGMNYGERYGGGFRGILPNGAAVVVDNNVATNKGGGTEDEIYVIAQSEAHLWEDPSAPMFIRAEQTAAASLGVLLVVYGYFAYTFVRRDHAQKINGTGLAAPVFA